MKLLTFSKQKNIYKLLKKYKNLYKIKKEGKQDRWSYFQPYVMNFF